MKRARTIALPRPKGTRSTSRVAVTLTMHPRQLAALEARAKAASMSPTAYVAALLESDAEDVPGANRRPARLSIAELASDSELIGAGLLSVQVPKPRDGERVPELEKMLAPFLGFSRRKRSRG